MPQMPQMPLLKTEYCNLPISVPKEWKADIQEKARRLGISRNAAFCLIVRMGAPLVESHLQLMEKSLKQNCRKVAAGKMTIKKLFR